jgi:hypothetical protein
MVCPEWEQSKRKCLTKRMRADAKQIAAVARTISQCFSDDALIQWLRPGRTPWNRNGLEQAWQRRRIQRAVFEGQVFRSNVITEAITTPSSHKGACTLIQEASPKVDKEVDDAGVAVMLYPPKEQQSYSLRRLWQGLKLWIIDRVAPVPDDGSKYEVRRLAGLYKQVTDIVKASGAAHSSTRRHNASHLKSTCEPLVPGSYRCPSVTARVRSRR